MVFKCSDCSDVGEESIGIVLLNLYLKSATTLCSQAFELVSCMEKTMKALQAV